MLVQRFKRAIALLLVISLNLTSGAFPAVIFAQEATSAAQTSQLLSATPEPTITAAVTPDPSPTTEPSTTPEPTLEITPTPESTPESTPTATPQPTVDPTPTIAPTLTASPSASISAPTGQSARKQKPINKTRDEIKASQGNYIDGEVIVKFKKGSINLKSFSGSINAASFENRYQVTKEDEFKDLNIEVVSAEKKSTEDLIEEIKKDPRVEYVEPNYIYKVTSISNDTDFLNLWGLNNTGQSVNGIFGTADKDIDAPEAWDLESNTQLPVVVAVIDTGVKYNHPDLQVNMWDGTSCKDDNGVTIPGGCPNHGWDFYNFDNDPNDDFGHGTHVAGTIAAVSDNSKGTSGISKKNKIKIMALKASDRSGAFSSSAIISSISFAKHNGAKVINASFGGGGYSQAFKDAIAAFPGLFVAAAGNNASNNDTQDFYPCSYDASNVICVAATTQSDNLPSFSNYGVNSVDIAAPGNNIYSTYPDVRYNNVLEQFNDLTTNSWIPTGNWGLWNTGDPGWGNVLYGDLNYPYLNNANSTITSKTFNFQNSETAYISFFTACDTEYNLEWRDYMVLEASSDGVNFLEIMRWDEVAIDMWNNDTDPTGSAFGYVSAWLPPNYYTNNFQFRFRWITNSSDNNYDGCWIDYMDILNITLGDDEKYNYLSGTSMASPHVAGAAGAIFSVNASLSRDQVKNILLSSADVDVNLNNKINGNKRLNLFTAFSQAQVPITTPTPTQTPTPTPTGTPPDTTPPIVIITTSPPVAVTNQDVVVTIDYGDSVVKEYNINQGPWLPYSGPITFTISTTYEVNARGTDASGNRTIVSTTFTIDKFAPSMPGIYAVAGDDKISAFEAAAIAISGSGEAGSDVLVTLSDGIHSVSNSTTIANIKVAGGPSPFSLTINGTSLNDGTITVSVEATDKAGNKTIGTPVFVVKDTVSPAPPVITDPAAPVAVSGNSYIIKGTTEANSAITVYKSGAVVENVFISGTDFAIPVTLTINSINGFGVTATDTVGNVSSLAIVPNITQDNTSPSIVSYSLDNPVISPNTTPGVNDTATFDLLFSELVDYDIKIKDSTGFTVKRFTGTATNPLAKTWDGSGNTGEGIYTIEVTIEDQVGHVTSDSSKTIRIDNDVLSLLPTSDKTIAEEDTLRFTAVAQEEEGNVVTYSVTNNPSGSSINANTGEFTWTPTEAQGPGSYTITISATNGSLTETDDVTITVIEVNRPPTTADQIKTTIEDVATTIVLIAKDSDIPANTLTFAIVSQPSHGLVSLSGNQVTYTPNLNYNGIDSFTFRAFDGIANSNTSTVSITVNPVNDVPACKDFAFLTNEDAQKTFQFDCSDVDGDAFAYQIITQPQHGTVSLGSLMYAPEANYHGIDPFTYRAFDGIVHSNIATVDVTVSSVNDAPVLSAIGNKTVNELSSLAFTASATDVDGDTVIYSLLNAPTGAAINSATGDFDFTPTEAQGPDSFTFTIVATDGVDSDSETITVTVNEVNIAPVAQGQTLTINEDAALTITLSATDADLPVNTLTYSIVSQPAHGSLVLVSGTAYTYLPDANYYGADSFTFRVHDGTTFSNTATVNIAVVSVNDIPVAQSQTVSTEKNQAKSITLSATDVDEDSLSYTIVSQPSNGILTQDAGNTYVYAPNAIYLGADAFTFSVNDGTVDSNVATISIEVNPSVGTGEVLISDNLTVDPSTPEVVVGNLSQDYTINVPSNVNNATLDLSNVSTVVGATESAVIASSININATTSHGNVLVQIPSGITVSGSESLWNGAINMPSVQPNSAVTIADGTVSSVIELGFGDVALTFDKAVKIVIPGQAGKLVGYSRLGTFTEITTVCSGDSQTVGDVLPAGGDCKIDDGSDVVIWTKHFTKFATYTKIAAPTSPSAPSNNNNNSSSSSSNSSPAVCNDAKPGSAPKLLSAVAGENSVTLTWEKAADPVTYYLIAYGLDNQAMQYGNPNIGGKDTTSYTVRSLAGGTRYFFKVRGGNNCMPGDFSNVLSAVPRGAVLESTIAQGFSEGVLGESEQASVDKTDKDVAGETTSASEEVAGETDEKQDGWGAKEFIFILLALLVLGTAFYTFKRK